MEFNQLIKKRYSCRKFSSQPVEKDKIIQCIEAAHIAPSACNAQPWRFIVLDEPEIKDEISEAATSGIYRVSKFIQNAPVLIVVVADKGSFLSKAGSLIRSTNFYLLDIGIACEHIVLQASELGLGTCYIGWFKDKAVKSKLNIPKKMIVPLIICLGYPDDMYKEKDPVRKRAKSDMRKPIDNILFFNKFEK